jgi:hypothetical protein
MKLNRHNIYKVAFPVALGFAALSYFLYKIIDGRENSQALKSILTWGTMPAAFSAFVFGLVTWWTKVRPPKEDKKTAQDEANELLREIVQSKGGILPHTPGRMVQITKLIEGGKPSSDWAERLKKLYRLVSASQLPKRYGQAEEPLLDWYMYDLCIIAAPEDVKFAKEVKETVSRLRRERGWRIYLDKLGAGHGEPPEDFARRVFYGGSWKCLVLLSEHTYNGKNNFEVNQAMARDRDAYENYLIPIAMDERGIEYMDRNPDLKKYAKNLRVIPNTEERFEHTVKIVLSRLEGSVYPFSSVQALIRRFAVSLSYARERRPFVEKVRDELRLLLDDELKQNGQEIFYDDDYAHEAAGQNMDVWLQTIYREQSELVAVFLCDTYIEKKWCGVEWGAINELSHKARLRVLPIQFNDAPIPGIPSMQGYINAENKTPEEVAKLIVLRLHLIRE